MTCRRPGRCGPLCSGQQSEGVPAGLDFDCEFTCSRERVWPDFVLPEDQGLPAKLVEPYLISLVAPAVLVQLGVPEFRVRFGHGQSAPLTAMPETAMDENRKL